MHTTSPRRFAAAVVMLLPLLALVAALTAGLAGGELSARAPYALASVSVGVSAAPSSSLPDPGYVFDNVWTPAYTPAYTVHAVCVTDAECAQWDAQQYTAPEYDATGNAHCEPLEELYDTLNPDLGDSGVVCRPVGPVALPEVHPLEQHAPTGLVWL